MNYPLLCLVLEVSPDMTRYTYTILAAACVIALLVYLLIGCVEKEARKAEPLKQVLAVIRNGERTPKMVYRNSPNQEAWEDGLDQLTPVGKIHMYELGKWLRGRYASLLDSDLPADALNVMSSSSAKCVVSAQAMLAGLMPSREDESSNPNANWQPIPVRYLPPEKDGLIMLKKPCPRMEKEINDTISSNFVTELQNENAGLFEFLTEKSGEDISDVEGASKIYDALVSELTNGLEIPDWAEEVLHGELQKLVATGKSWLTNSTTLKRLRGGPLLEEITNHLKEKVNDPDSQKGSMYIYAVHEQTVYDLIRSMGFEGLFEVDYGSCVLFELNEQEEGKEYTVRVLYFNLKHLEEPVSLIIPCCGEECDVDSFAECFIPIMPKYYDEECFV